MQLNQAKEIVKVLRDFAKIGQSQFQFSEIRDDGELSKFHQWADARPCKGAFLVKDSSDKELWILFLDWKYSGDYYMVLFPKSKSGPIAEIHKISGIGGELTLHWKYSPTKQDGKNPERKAYFAEAFLSDSVNISVPADVWEVSDFLTEVFSLAEIRQKADDLDENKPFIRDGFPEGKQIERLHLSRERNTELIRRAKEDALRRYGHLRCECCGFDFNDKYGELGKGYIEAHHTKPLSELHEDGGITNIEDLALVCANCHRMLHRRRPWLEMHELAPLLSGQGAEKLKS